MTDTVIRRAGDDDIPALARLRRSWLEEEEGPHPDPDFEHRFAAWYLDESPRRVTWLAEAGGGPVGTMNLAVVTRMPAPGRTPRRWGASPAWYCARASGRSRSTVGPVSYPHKC